MPGAKHKLTIRQWNEQENKAQGPVFTAMLNPAKYSRARKIEYTKGKALAEAPQQEKKLNCVAAETLDLDELIIDGTGIVDVPGGQAQDVDGQIDALRKILYSPGADRDVKIAVVEILWGSLSFQGRVENMTVSYTLFNANGTPLRARVKLSFTEYEQASSKVVRAAGAAPQTRQIRLVGGSSLPLLCFEAYNDPALHQAVALFNDLTSFRKLQPGTKMTLPKLK